MISLMIILNLNVKSIVSPFLNRLFNRGIIKIKNHKNIVFPSDQKIIYKNSIQKEFLKHKKREW